MRDARVHLDTCFQALGANVGFAVPPSTMPSTGETGPAYAIAVELGEKNRNPHLQCVIAWKGNTTTDALKAWLRRHLGETPSAAGHITYQVRINAVKPNTKGSSGWLYLVGYVWKDRGLAHFAISTGGFDDDFMQRACTNIEHCEQQLLLRQDERVFRRGSQPAEDLARPT